MCAHEEELPGSCFIDVFRSQCIRRLFTHTLHDYNGSYGEEWKRGLGQGPADISVSFTVKPEEEASDVCHRSPHASTLEPYINPPRHSFSLSSELPSSLPSPHFRCAGRPHQFSLVLGSWPYAPVREVNVELGQFSLISSPRLLFWAAIHGHLHATLWVTCCAIIFRVILRRL